MKYTRKLEPLYEKSRYIAEYYNTLSNLPLIIIGLLRLCELKSIGLLSNSDHNVMVIFYISYTLCGTCSFIHHGLYFKWSILIDYIPIVFSIINMYNNIFLISYISYTSYIKLLIAFLVLITDHIYTLIPVPFGHSLWHILISFSLDSSYQDILYQMISRDYIVLLNIVYILK
jgi:hypothetical protein